MLGVSVIICCYNSGWVIDRCLEALKKQKLDDGVKWEVILVDNCCSDNTVSVAEDVLVNSDLDWRIVKESKPGLMNARRTGIEAAKYSYLIYCDDDNLLCEDYINVAFHVMQDNEMIAACGGFGIPCFDKTQKPDWFDAYAYAYATGAQVKTQKEADYVLRLYGAGMCVRKACLKQLFDAGFTPVLTGRRGNKMLAGDDSELVCAFRILGQKIYADNRLQFQHVIKPQRLELVRFLQTVKGFGYSLPLLDVYERFLLGNGYSLSWQVKLFYRSFFKQYIIPKYIRRERELDSVVRYSISLAAAVGQILFWNDIKKLYGNLKLLKERLDK